MADRMSDRAQGRRRFLTPEAAVDVLAAIAAWLVLPITFALSGASILELVLYCICAGAFLSVFRMSRLSGHPTELIASVVMNILVILAAGGLVFAITSALIR
jgi:hypothetical protein